MSTSHVRLAVAAITLTCLLGCSKKTYRMPAGSMLPGIAVGEQVTADTKQTSPARGDVFVFKLPESQESTYVKRIVALPGDRVETKGQTLVINGNAVASCEVGPWSSVSDDGVEHKGTLRLEGSGYLVFYEASGTTTDGAWTVGPDTYWAMGDNRNNSHDSRTWFQGAGGGVRKDLLIGKVTRPPVSLPPSASALTAQLETCKKQLATP